MGKIRNSPGTSSRGREVLGRGDPVITVNVIKVKALEKSMKYAQIAYGRKKHINSKTNVHNLVLRLKNYCDDVLRFLINLIVPFTNNQAVRDVRMMKCKQKIAGGFRTVKGAKNFARIRGFISTARKQEWFVAVRLLPI